jgi:hypothetical protein
MNAPSPVNSTAPERRPWPEHWKELLARWVEEDPNAAETVLRLPLSVVGATTREACLGAVADALGETLPDKRALLGRAVQLLGWRHVLVLLVRAIELDEAGGLWSVAIKARRTRGGIFFTLMPHRQRQRLAPRAPRPPRPADVPPLTEAEIAAAHAQKGTITVTPKMTLMGRPALDGIARRGTYVSFTLSYKGAPSLPKGLPAVPKEATTYTVYLAAKKWPSLEQQLRSAPTDQLIMEGFPSFDAEVEGPALWVENATTQALRRAKFAKPSAEAPTVEPAVAGEGGVRQGEPVTVASAPDADGTEVLVARRRPS